MKKYIVLLLTVWTINGYAQQKENSSYCDEVESNELSLSKVSVKGSGLLLSKDEVWREYTIKMDDFNRILVTQKENARVRGELDVLKVIYSSDWSLLSDELFSKIEITKATIDIAQGAYSRKYGIFQFFVTLNIDDINMLYTDKVANLTILTAVSQMEKYITSFINHYQSSSYCVEPLFQVKVGGKEGVEVGLVDKQGNGSYINDIKQSCIKAKRKFDSQID